MNGANGLSDPELPDCEGVAVTECGQRRNFKAGM